MPLLCRKTHDFVLNARAIPRADALYLPPVHGGAPKIGFNNLGGSCGCRGLVARHLAFSETFEIPEGKRLFHVEHFFAEIGSRVFGLFARHGARGGGGENARKRARGTVGNPALARRGRFVGVGAGVVKREKLRRLVSGLHLAFGKIYAFCEDPRGSPRLQARERYAKGLEAL